MRVDFYLLSEEEPDAICLFTCRFIEKAYMRGHRVFVLCQSQKQAEELDELLWTFKEDSFIPHNLQGEGPEPPPPIQMGWDQDPRGFNDILINLKDTVPSYASKFKRIIEIVSASETAKQISRAHYRDYRAKGWPLHLHQITEKS